jgi:hypothetical protein
MATGSTILALTREDDAHGAVRAAAIQRARQGGATLILYDLDAGTDPLESPLPTEWSADGTGEKAGDRLGPQELEAAGRHPIAEQVRAARAAGIDAWGWLPSRDDSATLKEYAAKLSDVEIVATEDERNLTEDAGQPARIVRPEPDRA